MTKLQVRFLAAAVAAVLLADAASAQLLRVNPGGRVSVGNPLTGSAYNAPYTGGYNGGYGYNGMNNGYNFNGWNTGYGFNNGWNAPMGFYSNNQGMYYSTPSGYHQSPSYFATPGNGYSSYPQNFQYATPATGYTFPQQGTYQGVQPAGYTGTTDQGVVTAGATSAQGTMPTQMPGQGQWSQGSMASAQVLAPEGAMVTLSGVPANTMSGPRQFVSPPLDPKQTYVYRARVTWTDENGRQQTREKTAEVKAGQQVTIDLSQPTGSGTRSGTGTNRSTTDADREE